jgi:16S rRNA (uracil1498-N3)-methyltransferase
MAQKEFSARLYTDADLAADQGVVLDRAQAHYLGVVMRRQVGDEILLFNGRDGEWRAELQEIKKNYALVNPREQRRAQTQEPDIQLWFAPVKKIQTALIIQKATELGASALMPMQTVRTNADRLREEKMHLQAIEAAEQCERLSLPAIHKLQKLEQALKAKAADRTLIFCHERSDQADPVAVLSALKGVQKFAVLVGPEGGFTDEEREMITKCDGAHILGMGPRILRAETAVMSAMTLLQATCGDW